MNYLDVIKRGFALTWNNKFMWALGFLAALGSGASFSNSNYRMNSGDPAAMGQWLTPERMAALSAGLVAFGCIAFIVGIILWLVSLSAYGGLIVGATEMERGLGKPTFRSAFGAGWRRVWRLVGMSIVLYAIPVIIGIVLTVLFIGAVGGAAFVGAGMEDPGALTAGLGGVALVLACLLCLLVPFLILLSLIYPFAFRGIMLRNLGVMDSIRHGWQTVRAHLGEIILLVLAFFLITIIVFIVALAILTPVALVVGVPFVALMDSNAGVLQAILAVLGIVIGLLVIALVSAISTAWQSRTFTLAYLEWTGKDVTI